MRMAVGQLGWQAGGRGESGLHLVLRGAGEAVTRGEGASVFGEALGLHGKGNEQVRAMGMAVGDGGDLGCSGARGRSGSLSRHQVRNDGVEEGEAGAASGGSPEGGRAGHVPRFVVFFLPWGRSRWDGERKR